MWCCTTEITCTIALAVLAQTHTQSAWTWCMRGADAFEELRARSDDLPFVSICCSFFVFFFVRWNFNRKCYLSVVITWSFQINIITYYEMGKMCGHLRCTCQPSKIAKLYKNHKFIKINCWDGPFRNWRRHARVRSYNCTGIWLRSSFWVQTYFIAIFLTRMNVQAFITLCLFVWKNCGVLEMLKSERGIQRNKRLFLLFYWAHVSFPAYLHGGCILVLFF